MSGAGKALVTGGRSGLGRAFCTQLADAGFAVTSVDRVAADGDEPWRQVICDLSDREALDAMLEQVAADGPFGMLVLNAGVSATGRFEEIPREAHAKLLTVNAEAPILLCAGLAARGALAPGGTVIFVSSLSHMTGYPGAASYGASKDAVAVYAKSIRKPFRRDMGVSVVCAFPGPLRTAHAARHAPENADEGKRMEPSDAARLILADAARGRAKSVPGTSAKAFALAGRLFPRAVTWAMRRIVFDKLDREVW